MKKIFLLAAAVFITAGISAQSYKMVVKTNAGNKTEYTSTDIAKVVFRQLPTTAKVLQTQGDLVSIVDSVKAANPTITNFDIVLPKKGVYTQSAQINANVPISIAADSTAAITFTADAGILASDGVTLKNLVIDASKSAVALITMNGTPSTAAVSNYYMIDEPVTLDNVLVKGLQGAIYNDNGVKYALGNFTINNCVIQLNTAVSGVTFGKSGFIADLEISNSTIYNTSAVADAYIIQYQGRPKDLDANMTQTVAISNSTLYNLAYGKQTGNFKQYGQATNIWTLDKNIIVNCGKTGEFVRRLVGSNLGKSVVTFNMNTYWFDGVASNEATYDKSNTALTTDPGFKDAANGDFTISGADQKTNKTGDPRWIVTE